MATISEAKYNILSTTNYKIFKYIDSNRGIYLKHVANIMKSLGTRNLLHLVPAFVNGKMEVIDGQHKIAEKDDKKY